MPSAVPLEPGPIQLPDWPFGLLRDYNSELAAHAAEYADHRAGAEQELAAIRLDVIRDGLPDVAGEHALIMGPAETAQDSEVHARPERKPLQVLDAGQIVSELRAEAAPYLPPSEPLSTPLFADAPGGPDYISEDEGYFGRFKAGLTTALGIAVMAQLKTWQGQLEGRLWAIGQELSQLWAVVNQPRPGPATPQPAPPGTPPTPGGPSAPGQPSGPTPAPGGPAPGEGEISG